MLNKFKHITILINNYKKKNLNFYFIYYCYSKRNTGIKTQDTTTVDLSTENVNNITSDNKSSTKKILAISKANTNTSSGSIRKLSSTKKSRDIDSLDVWTHDLYNELDQTPKTRDELLASYGYDIREESEAPRARRHHKYG